jgi:hypothetical protein
MKLLDVITKHWMARNFEPKEFCYISIARMVNIKLFDEIFDRLLHAPVSLSSVSLGFGSRTRIVSAGAALRSFCCASSHASTPSDCRPTSSRLAGDARDARLSRGVRPDGSGFAGL